MNSEKPDLIRSSAETTHERRRHPRFAPEGVHTLLGEILDLSVSGMRVFHKGPAAVETGDEFDILLQHQEQDVLIPVRVVWVDPVGLRRQVIGLELTTTSAELQQRILSLHPDRPQPDAPGPQAYMMA